MRDHIVLLLGDGRELVLDLLELLGGVHLEGQDLLDAAGPQNRRHSDEIPLALLTGRDAELVLAIRGGRNDPLLVADNRLDHVDGAAGGRVESAGAHQLDDLAPADFGALDGGRDLFGGEQVADRNAVDAGKAREGNHVVAVAAEQHALDVFDADAEFHREEGLVAGDVERAGLTDDAIGREACDFPRDVHHRVERVAHDDDDRIRGVFLHLFRDRFHDAGVHLHKVVAAHAWLTGKTGGDHDDFGTRDVFVVAGADDLRVEVFDRPATGQVERLALGDTFLVGNVEQDDVAEFLGGGPVCAGASDVARSDDRDLRTTHSASAKGRDAGRGRLKIGGRL